MLSRVEIFGHISDALFCVKILGQSEVLRIRVDAAHFLDQIQVVILVEVSASLPGRGLFVNLFDELEQNGLIAMLVVYCSIGPYIIR